MTPPQDLPHRQTQRPRCDDTPGSATHAVERALADLADGKAVVVVDGADREDEGDLVFAAEKATPELMAFMVRHTSGYVCVPMTGEDLDRLELPQMVEHGTDRLGTAYTISVDARIGVTTGISAADRATTARILAEPATGPGDLVRPGHLLPLRARVGGVLERAGHTEAAVDLARLAGLRPAGVICEIVDDDGSMARLERLRAFAADHDLVLVSIAELIDYRLRTETLVERVASAALPTSYGSFRAVGFRDRVAGTEHVALVMGELGDGHDVLVRVHSECLTGDVFASRRCDCGGQLDASLARIANEGRGVLVYMRGHEGRGIGITEKLRAYALQEAGLDTVDANLALGHPVDARDYTAAAHILRSLGVRSIRLLSHNPAKRVSLVRRGIRVIETVSLQQNVTPENVAYLRTKRDRCDHRLDGLPDVDAVAPPFDGGAKRRASA